jgi:hypothetical protein
MTSLKTMPAGDPHIEGMEDKPYTKTSFLERINKDTPEKQQWLYTLSGYVQNIYGTSTEYLDVAQKTSAGQFMLLWPGMSTPWSHIGLEISKRKEWWELPKTEQEAADLKPSVVLTRDGHTFYVSLPEQIPWLEWFAILNKIYPIIQEKLKQYPALDESHGSIINDMIIQTLQEANHLKAALGEKAQKTTWGISGRLLDILKWLFGPKTPKPSADVSL